MPSFRQQEFFVPYNGTPVRRAAFRPDWRRIGLSCARRHLLCIGAFTPTEAAVMAVFYGLFIGFFIYRFAHAS